jgi:hypothetical protein
LCCFFRDSERERQREKEINRQVDERIQSKIHYQQKQIEKPSIIKSDQVAQTDHQVDRTVYIDEPIPKVPSVATKAFVRNLNSSSVQQNMLWDSESLYSQRTNSDMFVFFVEFFFCNCSNIFIEILNQILQEIYIENIIQMMNQILLKNHQ